jgi:hypothetical protein
VGGAGQWKELLADWSPLVLALPDYDHLMSPVHRGSGWIGNPGAPEERIAALETRVGMPLPPSYRSFLAVTSGWGPASPFVDRVLPADEVDWLSKLAPDTVEGVALGMRTPVAVENPMRTVQSITRLADDETPRETYDYDIAELAAALQVSGEGDAAMLLLNPRIRCGDEWEAWFFAHWLPGARRYPSFLA